MVSSKTEGMEASTQVQRLIAELSENDQQFRDARPLEAVNAVVQERGLGLSQTVALIMEGYADRPAVGERAKELVFDPVSRRTSLQLLPKFETMSYRELWGRARAVATELQHDGLRPIAAGDFVALLGFTSCDYTVLDLACLHLGAVPVPLQFSASAAQLKPIIEETRPRVLAVSIDYLDRAVELAFSSAETPRLIVFDYHPEVDAQRETFAAARKRLEEVAAPALDSLAGVLERGGALPPASLFTRGAGEDPLRLLIYTSGSTGTPKGAMYTDRMVRNWWSGNLFRPRPAEVPAIGVNFMPLSHIGGRASLFGTLGRGGISYFTARSDLSTLFEDITLVRPTELLLAPRICDLLFQYYEIQCERRAADFDDENELDGVLKAELRERHMGGRVLDVTCSSAPLSAEVKAFVESCLGVPVHNGYGSTEAGGILSDGQVRRPPVLDYKLVDVPDLGYRRTDSPYPRGELLVKTEDIFPGYYNRPEVTAQVFDADGYYRTGDIMAEIAPDRLVYVDRRNNVLKLSQGEFVAISRLEAIFSTIPLVSQVFVHGSSERAYVLAVIVPKPEAMQQAGTLAQLKSSLAASLHQVGKQAELNSYEIPRDFLIETEPFTIDNGLLSDVGKMLRPRLKERYGERLEQLYGEITRRTGRG